MNVPDAMNTSLDDADELRMTAIHEAGHFVMSAIVGGMPRTVTIAKNDDYLGMCGGYDNSPTPTGAILYAMHSLAGAIACDYYGDYEDWLGSDADIKGTVEKLREYYDPIEPVLERAEHMTRRIMTDRRVGRAIDEVAEWLFVTITPTDDDIADKHVAISRRIGFLRNKVYRWIEDDCLLADAAVNSCDAYSLRLE